MIIVTIALYYFSLLRASLPVYAHCAQERAGIWYKFLKGKFAATERELKERPEMPTLPMRDPENRLTKKEVESAINTLKNHKAVGDDGIPIEIYKESKLASTLLHSLLARVWQEEKVPESMGVAVFKMIYKRKGSPDDPSKYR